MRTYCSNGCNVQNTFNTTYITNINVNNPCVGPFNGRHAHGHRHVRRHVDNERPPEMLRYCRTCGLLDRDKLSVMSNGQIAEGAVDVLRYSVHDLGKCARIAAQGCGDAASGLVGIVQGVFSLVATILK